MLTIERQIEFGKRKTDELKAKLADPVTAKLIEQQVIAGNAFLAVCRAKAKAKVASKA